MRLHYNEPLTLAKIAREAGASSYHFARLFLAYTAETPFDFIRRLRLTTAMRMLHEDLDGSITEIGMSVGYETPSAFNKVFKKSVHLSPTDFRNLGKAEQKELIYDFSQPRVQKETALNLTSKFEIVHSPLTHYVYVEKCGPFPEIAPPTWNEMFVLGFGHLPQDRITAFLGLSTIDKSKVGDEAMIYQAGVALSESPSDLPKGLSYKKIKSGSYARFVLTGPYSQIWPAFNFVFKNLAENNVELREDFCIENYLNDPKSTPEDQLLTEILIPMVRPKD